MDITPLLWNNAGPIIYLFNYILFKQTCNLEGLFHGRGLAINGKGTDES
jgi:hypothetical protein